MIRNRDKLQLELSVDDSVVNADVSVSLGLIVTELVINALKHAFPGDRAGKIMVDYFSYGPNWRLSVRDNGVGMPANPESTKPGLGTSIVEALVRQLNSRIKVADAHPGTDVSIIHAQLATVAAPAKVQTNRAV
jgi:two-component sensor histidine kinase